MPLVILLGFLAIFLGKVYFTPPTYISHVLPEDCALCGEGNPLRGVNTVAFVTVHDWKIRDIGLNQFNGLPGTDGVEYLSYEGAANRELEGSYTGIHFITRSDHTWGTTGVVTTYSRYGVISAVLNLEDRSSTQRGDRERLSTLLCPGCYEAVLEATEELDCFLLDCGRLEVYSLQSPDREFQIGAYDFKVQFTTPTDLVFLGFIQAMSGTA